MRSLPQATFAVSHYNPETGNPMEAAQRIIAFFADDDARRLREQRIREYLRTHHSRSIHQAGWDRLLQSLGLTVGLPDRLRQSA